MLSLDANGRGAFGGLRFSMLDLRLGGRMIVKHPTLTVIATIAVAFAIAVGTVESESNRKTIQHLEGGIVREILVADGDVVRAGQTLISLEDTKARAEAQSLQGQLWEAIAGVGVMVCD